MLVIPTNTAAKIGPLQFRQHPTTRLWMICDGETGAGNLNQLCIGTQAECEDWARRNYPARPLVR